MKPGKRINNSNHGVTALYRTATYDEALINGLHARWCDRMHSYTLHEFNTLTAVLLRMRGDDCSSVIAYIEAMRTQS